MKSEQKDNSSEQLREDNSQSEVASEEMDIKDGKVSSKRFTSHSHDGEETIERHQVFRRTPAAELVDKETQSENENQGSQEL